MENYEFLPSEELPCLVLAILQNPEHLTHYNFKPKRKWLKIQHQTAGHGCHQVFIDVLVLKPRDFAKMNRLAKSYDNSCLNMFGLSLDIMLEYRKRLNDLLEVDCNETVFHLEEGIYPVDATTENIRKLCKDRLPKDLDDLIAWDSEWEKMYGFINRWHLFILGDNCD